MPPRRPAPDPLALAADYIRPPEEGYSKDPVRWANERAQAYLWSKQKEICESVVKNRFTAVHSCHGTGKSFISGGILVPWWIDAHPIGESFVVTSAPTAAQIEAILWREIGRTHRKMGLRGRITAGAVPMWKIGAEIVGFGRKPQDLTSEEQARQAFQGIHARYVLVVLDEACGVPGWLWDAALALVTNSDCRVLAIGNPDDPASKFREVCLDRPNTWNSIHIDAFDTPLFTGEYVPEYLSHLLISPDWVREVTEEWGDDSPIYEAKVRGRFPIDTQSGVIPWSYMTKCRNHEIPLTDWEALPNELGIDPAAGGDQFTIHHRMGPKWMKAWRFSYKDTMQSTGEVVRIINETGATRVKIDNIGIGKGVADRLREMTGIEHNADVVDVNVSRTTSQPKRFHRLRDELWWDVGRKLIESQALDLTLLDDRTAHQLTSVQYSITSGGRIEIEPKDETRKRIKRSPDDADAFLLAFFYDRSDGAGASIPKAPSYEPPVVRKGDLTLVGERYIDKS